MIRTTLCRVEAAAAGFAEPLAELVRAASPTSAARTVYRFWTQDEVNEYIKQNDVPFNEMLTKGYDSIGCAPCSRPGKGRAGRWWWESDDESNGKECGLHNHGLGI